MKKKGNYRTVFFQKKTVDRSVYCQCGMFTLRAMAENMRLQKMNLAVFAFIFLVDRCDKLVPKQGKGLRSHRHKSISPRRTFNLCVTVAQSSRFPSRTAKGRPMTSDRQGGEGLFHILFK